VEKSKQEILKTPLISFVVVNYNGEEYLRRCLSSIEKEPIDFECIVVDNGSIDNSRKVIEGFNVIRVFNKENRGYPRAVNQGIGKSKGKYIFLLSPTTYLKEGSLKRMIHGIEQDDIGAVAPKLLDEKGRAIHSIRSIPTPLSFFWETIGGSRIFPFVSPWKLPHFDYSKKQEVKQPMSCAFLIKREVINEIGLFDERFFLYFSDIDFSKRLLKKYKTYYLAEAKAIHERGGTTVNLGAKRIRILYRDLIYYLKKHHPLSLPFIGILIIAIGELRYLCSKLIQSLRVGKK